MPEQRTEAARRVSKRQAQADARREQLLKVALELFAERGIRGATIREIAAAAGVAEGLVYHYFPGKKGLVRAVIERYTIAGEMNGVLEEVQVLPAAAAYRHIGRRILRMLSANRRFFTMIVAEAQRDPEVARVFGETIGGALGRGQRFIGGRIAAGELRPHDPALSIRLYQGALFWFFLMQQTLAFAFPPVSEDDFLEGVVEILMHGVAAQPADSVPGADAALEGASE